MNNDKLIFGAVIAFTILIFSYIISASFSKPQINETNLSSEMVLGSDVHQKGATEPKVTLVEFSDFECPSCHAVYPIVENVLAKYPNELALVYRQFPLPQHSFALPAAKASEAAAIQGKFWEYHSELFLNFDNFTQSELESYASNIGLNVDQFKSDMQSAEVLQKVNEDLDVARDLQLSGTPSFFLIYNGKVESVKLNSYAELESVVDKAIEAVN